MFDEPQAKRPRPEEEPTLGTRYKLQSVAVNAAGVLWPAFDIVLEAREGRVIVDGKAPHGSWCFEKAKNLLHMTWHWDAVEAAAKKATFVRIPDTQCFVQIGCPPEWQCVLVPVVGHATSDAQMDDA